MKEREEKWSEFSKNQRLVAGTLAGVILVGSLATVVNAISGGNGVIGNYSVNESAGTDEAFQKAAEDYILEIAQQGVQAMHDKNSVNVMTYTDMDIFYYQEYEKLADVSTMADALSKTFDSDSAGLAFSYYESDSMEYSDISYSEDAVKMFNNFLGSDYFIDGTGNNFKVVGAYEITCDYGIKDMDSNVMYVICYNNTWKLAGTLYPYLLQLYQGIQST
ncbi:hypothetical protein DWX94_04040 [Coprococcus eutactus]|uniref:Uncharacterized protein n=1 Tax=Coprococcus eutactus TaxID=33043 RepID=A0A3R5WKL8_9FIRM|nr:hypothetical protein DWX94_04040 [Coprococcus eutactus]